MIERSTPAGGRMRFLLPAMFGSLGLVAVLAAGVALSSRSHSIDSALAAGRRPDAPSLSLPLLGGSGTRALSGYRGKVVVLNFWASWCPPCRSEAPLLARWQPFLAGRGGTLLGVDVLDVSSDALAFARREGVDYPVVRDEDGSHERDFGVFGYPETIVIDRHGRIAAVQRGPVDATFFADVVTPLLRERA